MKIKKKQSHVHVGGLGGVASKARRKTWLSIRLVVPIGLLPGEGFVGGASTNSWSWGSAVFRDLGVTLHEIKEKGSPWPLTTGARCEKFGNGAQTLT